MVKKNKKLKMRLLAAALAVVLTFTSVDLPSFAEVREEPETVTEADAAAGEIYSSYQSTGFDSNAGFVEGDEDNHYYATELPSSYNKTLSDSAFPATRSQSPWGSCWAHSAIYCAEASMIKQGLATTSVDYSEMALAYFSYHTATDPLGGTVGDDNHILVLDTEVLGYDITNGTFNSDGKRIMNYLQRGGNNAISWRVLATWCGATDETVVPYEKTKIAPETISSDYAYKQDSAILTDVRAIAPTDRDSMKRAIMEYGAISGNYNDNSKYYSETYNSYYCTETSTNHAIAIVGWDDSFPKENFVTEAPADGAWLIRNSWSVVTPDSSYAYSHHGYFWISYEDTSILKENKYAYVYTTSDTYDNNYQYDGGTATYPCMKSTVANVFTVCGNKGADYEELRAVSFAAAPNNSSTSYTSIPYVIKIYSNVSDNNPTSGTLERTISGTTTYAGYYTINLDEPLKMAKGTKFSVVITTSDNKYIDCEKQYDMGWCAGEVGISAGQSFYLDGSKWVDMYETQPIKFSNGAKIGNLCIKAFTVDSEVTEVEEDDCKIVFYGNGSTSGSMDNVAFGKSDTGKLPENKFIKTDYTFTGWNTKIDGTGTAISDKAALSSIYKKGETIQLYAQWKVVEYTYHFVFNYNGIENIDKTVSYTEKLDLYEIGKNKREGYVASKWSTSKNPDDSNAKIYSGEILWPFGRDVKEVTLYAQWSVLYMTVMYYTNEANGYWVYYTQELVPYGGKAKGVIEPEKDGYVFDCWVDEDGNEFDYDTVLKDDIDLYSSWTELGKYSVTFDANGGIFKTSQKSTYEYNDVEEGTTVNAPDDEVTKTGYTFDGWYTDATGGTKVDFSKSIDEETTFYAHWNANNYKVYFFKNEKEEETSYAYYKDVYYDSQIGTTQVPVRDYYSFDGWYTEKTGGDKYTENTVYKTTEDIKLYAHWTRNIVKVSFITGDESTDEISDVYMYAGQDYSKQIVDGAEADFELPAVKNVEEGLLFAGWKDKDGNVIDENSIVPDEESVTLYAYYIDDECTLTLDLDGGFFEEETELIYTFKRGETITITDEPVKLNYSFYGWYDGSTYYFTDSDLTVSDDLILKAVWNLKYVVSEPKFSEISGAFVPVGTVLYITTDTPGAEIYYKIGSDVQKEDKLVDDCIRYTNGILLDEVKDYDIYVAVVKEGYYSIFGMIFLYACEPKPDWGEITEEDIMALAYDINKVPTGLWVMGDSFAAEPVYNGKAYTYDSIRVYYGTKLLTKNTDYTVSYKNNVNAGEASLVITGKGNFKGTVTKKFTIAPQSFDDGFVVFINQPGGMTAPVVAWSSKAGAAVYEPVLQTLDGKTLKKGTDYTLTLVDESGNAINLKKAIPAGTVYATVTGIKNYTGKYEYSYTVEKTNTVYNLSSVKVTVPAVTYTGEAITLTGTTETPAAGQMLVKDSKGNVLTEGTDYYISSVTYKNNINAGTASVTICACSDSGFYGTKTVSFKINKRPITSENVWLGDEYRYYWTDGNPEVMYYAGMKNAGTGVVIDGKDLICGKDYKVSFKNANKVGTATVTFEGKGNYSGKVTKKYNIIAKKITSENISYNGDFYGKDNKDFAQNPVITDGSTVLKKGTDYTISYYVEGVKVGKTVSADTAIEARITGKGNYSCEESFVYMFRLKADISAAVINATDTYTFVNGGVKPSGSDIEIVYDGKLLTEGVDYTLSYKNNKKVAANKHNSKSPYVVVTGKGKFKGTTKLYFAITPKDLSTGTITASDVAYSSKSGNYKASPVVKDSDGKILKSGTDYKIVGYYCATDTFVNGKYKAEGTALGAKDKPASGTQIYIVVEGKGNYSGKLGEHKDYSATVVYTYKIAKASISGAKVSSIPTQYCTGYEVKPSVTVTIGGETLSAADYTITYSNNIKKGTAKITITGKGDYCGSKTVTFKIKERNIQ